MHTPLYVINMFWDDDTNVLRAHLYPQARPRHVMLAAAVGDEVSFPEAMDEGLVASINVVNEHTGDTLLHVSSCVCVRVCAWVCAISRARVRDCVYVRVYVSLYI